MEHYQVNEKEYEKIITLKAEERYKYFIKKICDWEEVWSIKNDAGWCLMGSGNEQQCIQVWPAHRYAEVFCDDEWKDCNPTPIPLDKWIQNWIPGMEKDGTLVAVFPIPTMKGIIRKPDDLLIDIQEELKKY